MSFTKYQTKEFTFQSKKIQIFQGKAKIKIYKYNRL